MMALSFLMVCTAMVYGAPAAELSAQPQSVAYQKYQNRPKNELSKLIYLMDRFKGTDYGKENKAGQ